MTSCVEIFAHAAKYFCAGKCVDASRPLAGKGVVSERIGTVPVAAVRMSEQIWMCPATL